MHALLRALELLVVFAVMPVAVRLAHTGPWKLLVLAAFAIGCLVLLATRIGPSSRERRPITNVPASRATGSRLQEAA